tara:strand:- start:1095 stop:1964 length:870 start_codon:yes stop_codon:yes gene_type:complete
MKTIDTLVDDIYSLFKTSVPDMSDEEVDIIISKFGDSVAVHLKAFIYEEERRRDSLRLSAIGKPERQQWYAASPNSTVKETIEIQAKDKIKFLYGYILEELLLTLSYLAGHSVTDQQKEVQVEGVKGHQDAIIDDVLVDCKSASGKGFDKFKNNYVSVDDPFGYIAQISSYAEANGLDQAAFLAINKQTGEICLSKVHSMEMINAKERVKYIKDVVNQSTPPAKCYPDVPDGKSGNRKLDIGCIYCDYKRDCWKDANNGQGLRVFDYATNPRYLTQVSKMPNVEEILDW